MNREALRLGYRARAMIPRGGKFGQAKADPINLAAALLPMINGGFKAEPHLITRIHAGREAILAIDERDTPKRIIALHISDRMQAWLAAQNFHYEVGEGQFVWLQPNMHRGVALMVYEGQPSEAFLQQISIWLKPGPLNARQPDEPKFEPEPLEKLAPQDPPDQNLHLSGFD